MECFGCTPSSCLDCKGVGGVKVLEVTTVKLGFLESKVDLVTVIIGLKRGGGGR